MIDRRVRLRAEETVKWWKKKIKQRKTEEKCSVNPSSDIKITEGNSEGKRNTW